METRTHNLRHQGWYSIAARFKAEFERWSINFETRQELLTLDEHLLRDIGIDHNTAETEGNKPFWRN